MLTLDFPESEQLQRESPHWKERWQLMIITCEICGWAMQTSGLCRPDYIIQIAWSHQRKCKK